MASQTKITTNSNLMSSNNKYAEKVDLKREAAPNPSKINHHHHHHRRRQQQPRMITSSSANKVTGFQIYENLEAAAQKKPTITSNQSFSSENDSDNFNSPPPTLSSDSASTSTDSSNKLDQLLSCKFKKYFLIDNRQLDTSLILDSLKASKSNDNDDEAIRLSSSLNLLSSQIRAISKKHLTNILSTGYETSDFLDIHQTDLTANSADRPKHKKQTSSSKLFYIINKSFLSRVLTRPDCEINNNNDESATALKTNYLSLLYLFVKFSYLIVALGQVFVLNRLLNGNPGNHSHLK